MRTIFIALLFILNSSISTSFCYAAADSKPPEKTQQPKIRLLPRNIIIEGDNAYLGYFLYFQGPGHTLLRSTPIAGGSYVPSPDSKCNFYSGIGLTSRSTSCMRVLPNVPVEFKGFFDSHAYCGRVYWCPAKDIKKRIDLKGKLNISISVCCLHFPLSKASKTWKELDDQFVWRSVRMSILWKKLRNLPMCKIHMIHKTEKEPKGTVPQ